MIRIYGEYRKMMRLVERGDKMKNERKEEVMRDVCLEDLLGLRWDSWDHFVYLLEV